MIVVLTVQSEVEAGKVALEQAEMAAVVAATECMNMQKVQPHTGRVPIRTALCWLKQDSMPILTRIENCSFLAMTLCKESAVLTGYVHVFVLCPDILLHK